VIFARTEIHTLSRAEDIVPRTGISPTNAVVYIGTHPRINDLGDATDVNDDLWKRSIVDLHEETSRLHPVLEPNSGITVHGLQKIMRGNVRSVVGVIESGGV
jgi:hypothetical protein